MDLKGAQVLNGTGGSSHTSEHFCQLCYCNNTLRGCEVCQIDNVPCKVVGCTGEKCCHWPVIVNKPAEIILEEDQILLEMYSLGELNALKRDEARDVCIKLQYKTIRIMPKKENRILTVDISDKKCVKDDYLLLINEWYSTNKITFANYNLVSAKIIKENLKVRNIEPVSNSIKALQDQIFAVLTTELKYKRQEHIKSVDGHILEDVSSIVVDLLHLQVTFLCCFIFLQYCSFLYIVCLIAVRTISYIQYINIQIFIKICRIVQLKKLYF